AANACILANSSSEISIIRLMASSYDRDSNLYRISLRSAIDSLSLNRTVAMGELELLRAAVNAGAIPTIFISAGYCIGVACRGIAQIILARQGKSPPLPKAPANMTTLVQMIFLLAGILAATEIHLLIGSR